MNHLKKSNKLKLTVNKLKYLLEMNVKEIAESIDYSRVHLTKEMGKEEDDETSEALRLRLEDKHKITLQNDSRGTIDHDLSYLQKRNSNKLSSIRKNTVPFYDAEASAGITATEMTPIHAPAGTIDVGDLLHDSKAAIRIYGNSMLPNYPPGCVLGIDPSNSNFIEPGEVYVIETRDRRLFKRLFYKDDNTDGELITCYSDNIMLFEGGPRHGKPAYPPFDLPKSEIVRLFVVTGVIKRNANSVVMHRNN